jgi:hypothetical protein
MNSSTVSVDFSTLTSYLHSFTTLVPSLIQSPMSSIVCLNRHIFTSLLRRSSFLLDASDSSDRSVAHNNGPSDFPNGGPSGWLSGGLFGGLFGGLSGGPSGGASGGASGGPFGGPSAGEPAAGGTSAGGPLAARPSDAWPPGSPSGGPSAGWPSGVRVVGHLLMGPLVV